MPFRRSRRSRRPAAAAVVVIVISLLGAIWYFGSDPADVQSITEDTLDDLTTHGGAALDTIGDIADSGSAALEDLGDAARDAADSLDDSQPNIPAVGDDTPNTPETPFDRTIFPGDPTHDSLSEPISEPTKTERIENLIHDSVNRHRLSAGLDALERDIEIDAIARDHSQDMAERGYFEHHTPEGLDPTDRADLAGYECMTRYDTYYTYGLAENIFHHTGTWYGAERLASESMNGWMNSPGHRQNIMNPDYNRLGVGVAIGASGMYATQNFC